MIHGLKEGAPQIHEAILTTLMKAIEEKVVENWVQRDPERTGIITGSFNSTKAAEEKNEENLLVIRDKTLTAKYVENWKIHAEHLELYPGRGR